MGVLFFSTISPVYAKGTCKEGECTGYYCEVEFKGDVIEQFDVTGDTYYHYQTLNYVWNKFLSYNVSYTAASGALSISLNEVEALHPGTFGHPIEQKSALHPSELKFRVYDHPLASTFELRCELNSSKRN